MPWKRPDAPLLAANPPLTQVFEKTLGRGEALGAVHSAAWMSGRAREVQPRDRSARAPHARVRAQEELLLQLVAAAAQVSADHRRVLRLHLLGAARCAREHDVAEARSERF